MKTTKTVKTARTVKVSEFAGKFGGLPPGTKLIALVNLPPHCVKGGVMTVMARRDNLPYYLLSGCAAGTTCYCKNAPFAAIDAYFEVLLEDEISEDDLASARSLPDVDSVADDVRRMLGQK